MGARFKFLSDHANLCLCCQLHRKWLIGSHRHLEPCSLVWLSDSGGRQVHWASVCGQLSPSHLPYPECPQSLLCSPRGTWRSSLAVMLPPRLLQQHQHNAWSHPFLWTSCPGWEQGQHRFPGSHQAGWKAGWSSRVLKCLLLKTILSKKISNSLKLLRIFNLLLAI